MRITMLISLICLRHFQAYLNHQTSPNRLNRFRWLSETLSPKTMLTITPPNFLLAILIFLSACSVTKVKDSTPVVSALEDAPKSQLLNEIDRFAKVNSMRAKMDLKFEDNSFAQFGNKEVYPSADCEVVIQRPANIYLKVEVPIVKVDVAQMSSDGEKFRVAVLQGGSCGEKCKKFVIGTNNADYSKLQKNLHTLESANGQADSGVNSFANVRPQHFTDAVLVRPTNAERIYLQTTIYQVEEDESQKKNSPLRRVMRGYYLLDELKKGENGELKILRRFWFDRIGGIRLARQQLFDAKDEIESDIVYGREGNLGSTGDYNNLPMRIQVTRPKEKYTMSLTYQSPASVMIGKAYLKTTFELKNTWGLEEVNLDEKLEQGSGKSEMDAFVSSVKGVSSFFGGTYSGNEPKPMNLHTKQLDVLADFYESAKSSESVFDTCKRTGLMDKFTEGSPFTLIPETENTAYVGGFSIAFIRDSSGTVTQAVVHYPMPENRIVIQSKVK